MRAVGVILILLGLTALGAGLTFWFWRHLHGLKGTPQEITLDQLLTHGPGDNAYVTLRDYGHTGGSRVVSFGRGSEIIESYLKVPGESDADAEAKKKSRRYQHLRASYLRTEEERVHAQNTMTGTVHAENDSVLRLNEGWRPESDVTIAACAGGGVIGIGLGWLLVRHAKRKVQPSA